MKKVLGAATAIALFASGLLTAPSASASGTTEVGMWYATWYSKVPTLATDWRTGFGGSSLNQFVGDANGDGKDDAVTFGSGGTWDVALSNGNGFGTPSQWVTGHGSGSTEQFLADVNGDGKQDAVVYFNTDTSGDGFAGDWYAALSTGSSFASYTLWKSGAGANATKRMLADASGDGKADAIAFYTSDTGGKWALALSSGTAFGALNVWKTNFGGGSNNQFVADTNRDGRADAIYFTLSNGNWFKANSNGTSAFGTAETWTTTHGIGSVGQFVYDGNGDGYHEPYLYFNADVVSADGLTGDWVGREYDRSTGGLSGENLLLNSGFGYGAGKLMYGNVNGDEYGWKASVAFYPSSAGGTWKVQRYRQKDTVSTNTWLGFPGKPEIKYRPLTLGSYQTYDSGDAAVIDEHLATLADAKVDWLLLDETNGLNNVSGAILNRAKKVAQRIKAWNDNAANRDVKYAFAIGRAQWTNDPLTIEQEAGQVWAEFANDAAVGGANYHYQLNGKPLLVVYVPLSVQNAWNSYGGSKTNTNHFTVRFASTSAAGEYGWQLPPTGTVDDAEVMNVMPGWNNHVGGYTPVSRNNGSFYSQLAWEKVLAKATKPSIVVVNSFNEFAEDTGVQTADTSALTTSEKWYNSYGAIDNAMYWNMTKSYIAQLNNPSSYLASLGFASTQGANNWSYQEWSYSGATRTINTMTWDAANSRWKGTGTYALVGGGWMHPDANKESVRVFTAPAAGTVTITGNVAKQTALGDGVKVKIKKNDVDFWPAGGGFQTVTTTTGYNILLTTTLAVGDKLQFVVDYNGGTIDYDTTNWNPAVTYP